MNWRAWIGRIRSRRSNEIGSGAAKARRFGSPGLLDTGSRQRPRLQHHRLHHPTRHALRRDLHGARTGKSTGRSNHHRQSGVNRSRIIETQIAAKSDLERTDLAKEKTGVFTGAFAINPANNERIPIWIADYVLMGYGTGAIMGVPGARRAGSRIRAKISTADRAGRPSAREDAGGIDRLHRRSESQSIHRC